MYFPNKCRQSELVDNESMEHVDDWKYLPVAFSVGQLCSRRGVNQWRDRAAVTAAGALRLDHKHCLLYCVVSSCIESINSRNLTTEFFIWSQGISTVIMSQISNGCLIHIFASNHFVNWTEITRGWVYRFYKTNVRFALLPEWDTCFVNLEDFSSEFNKICNNMTSC